MSEHEQQGSMELMDLEIKLLKTLVEGPEQVKAYLAKRIRNHDVFQHIPNVWAQSIEYIDKGEPYQIHSFNFLEHIPTIEKGMAEGAQYDTALQTIEETEELCKRVLKIYFKNKLILEMAQPLNELNSDEIDPMEAMQRISSMVEALTGEAAKQDAVGLGIGYQSHKVADMVLSTLVQEMLPTGIEGFDKVAGGLAEGEQLIVACPTSSGKTLLMNQIALNIGLGLQNRAYTREPRSVLYFSLEMSDADMWKRLISNLSSIPMDKFRQPQLLTPEDNELVRNTIEQLGEYLSSYGVKLTLIGGADCDMSKIKAELATHKYAAIFVDYINLMCESDALWSEMGKIGRDLKILAQVRKTRVITAAQLDEDSLKIRYSRMVKEHCDLLWVWTPSAAASEKVGVPIESAFTEIFVEKGRNTGKFSFWVNFNFKYMQANSVNPAKELGMYEAPSQSYSAPTIPSLGVAPNRGLPAPDVSATSIINQMIITPESMEEAVTKIEVVSLGGNNVIRPPDFGFAMGSQTASASKLPGSISPQVVTSHVIETARESFSVQVSDVPDDDEIVL